MKYFFSIAFSLIILLAHAQEADTVKGEEPSRERDWNPSMLMVNFDGGRAFSSLFLDKNSFEAGLMVDSDVYFLEAEVGRASTERKDSYDYLSEGNYYRIGISRNMSPFSKDRNYFTFGLKYAQANFTNSISFEEENIYYGPQTVDLQSSNMRARWWELNGGIRIRVWEQLYFGYVIRVKIFKDVFNKNGIEPWDIPGFGRHKRSGTQVKSTTLGLNYQISWRIPYRTKPIPPKPRSK